MKPINAMNWKKIVLLGYVVTCVFAVSSGTAQMRGHSGSMPRVGMRGAFMPRSMGQMPMQRAPMRNSAFGFHHFNDVIFIGDFGFPWWWGWGPWWGWNWGYPYGYYGGYGSGYGYGDSSGSRVAELQRLLARAGYYHGVIDGIMGPATRRAIRAYERDRGYVG